jgi:SAM-dependent methyltransferase
MMGLKKTYQRLERLLFPDRARARRQRKWDDEWARDDFTAPWLGRGTSKEIISAVETSWFPAGERVLDIGCGQGEVALWFAERGFPTLGIDFSAAAIERARERQAQAPGRLEFRVVDITREAPGDGSFGILVDRGCFHSLARDEAPVYVEHVAASGAAGARFLLFIKAFRGDIELPAREERELHERQILQQFSGRFEILRCEETFLDPYDGQRPEHSLPGLVFWMRRR